MSMFNRWSGTRAFLLNNVKVSLHPAGHIIGSAQIRVEYNNEVWVVGGDHKLENDGISGEFEPVRCHTFISESTFWSSHLYMETTSGNIYQPAAVDKRNTASRQNACHSWL
ncbi:MAG: hypothetical protein WDN26_22105 [Chitinophagaceae bacterium]